MHGPEYTARRQPVPARWFSLRPSASSEPLSAFRLFGLSGSGPGIVNEPLYPVGVRRHDAENSSDDAEGRRDERFLHGDLTRMIIGAFYAVHSKLGAGFLENVYSNALAVMLRKAGIHVEREVPFELFFEGVSVGVYRADLVVASSVIVETKTANAIDARHKAQLLNYLRVSGLEVGLVLNFSHKAEFKRIALTRK